MAATVLEAAAPRAAAGAMATAAAMQDAMSTEFAAAAAAAAERDNCWVWDGEWGGSKLTTTDINQGCAR